MDPQGLDNESRNDDPGDDKQDDGVIRGVIGCTPVAEAIRFGQITAVESHQDPGQHRQPEEIHEEGKDQIELADQERDP